MPDIKLYTANTMNGWKSLIFLHEAEVDYELIPINFSRREQKELSSLLKESRKLRGSGAQARKAKLAGNVEHIARRFNAGSVCAGSSRRSKRDSFNRLLVPGAEPERPDSNDRRYQ